MKYNSPVKAYPHQKEALQKMAGCESFALLMAMRTGKTKVILDDFGTMELEGKTQDMLVIAPAGVYRTWLDAMREHFSADLKDRAFVHTFSSSANKKERMELDTLLNGNIEGPRILLMNIEALSRPGPARGICEKFLKQRSGYVVIDESTTIKNKSKRTDYVIKFIRPLATYRRILSGLATPRSPLDLYYQFEFLDWEILGWRSYYTFRAAVAIMQVQQFGGRYVQIVVGYRPEAVAELQKLIEPASFRVPFRPDIPSTWSIREVEMTEEQKFHYDEIKEFATTQLSETAHVTATIVIAQLMRMHQVLCGHVGDEDGNQHIIPEYKTDELMALLEDYAGKAIIWCSYNFDVMKLTRRITMEYGNESVARFWGGNQNSREKEEAQFKNNPQCRFMIATPAAGGRGRTWDCADLVIYYSSTDNLEHRDQSEQRAMGIGKKRQVDFVDLIHPNTVEMKILEALRKKINMSSAINGDNYKSWII